MAVSIFLRAKQRRVGTGAVLWGASVAALLMPGLAGAQSLPASVDPNRLSDQFKTPEERHPQVELDVPAPAPESPLPPNAENIRFTLQKVTIDGANTLPADGFASLYRARIGETVTLAELYQWADAITAAYRDAGYILSRAVVPAQRISGGAARIVVVEGFIDQVTIQGTSSPALVAYGERLKRSRPLKADDLERYLLLANDLPGMSVRSVLVPSGLEPGASDLTLIATETRVDGTVEVDNRGTRYVGPWQGYAAAGINDLLGLNDRTGLRYATSAVARELSYLEVNESLPIDGDGTSLSFTASRTRAAPGYTLADLGAHSTGAGLLLGVRHAFIRQRSETLSAGLNFDYRDGTTLMAKVPATQAPSSDDRIRALRGTLSYDVADGWGGQDQANVELSHGLSILDASTLSRHFSPSTASRPYGDPQFTKLVFGASRTTPIIDSLALLTAMQGQTAFGSALLSGEQFGLGGGAFGRGYDPSEITGDDGIAGKIELQWTPDLALRYIRYTQFYSFYDVGEVATRHVLKSGDGSTLASLASVGVGTRLSLFDSLTSNLELAKPLTRSLAADRGHGDAKSWHLFFSLTQSF